MKGGSDLAIAPRRRDRLERNGGGLFRTQADEISIKEAICIHTSNPIATSPTLACDEPFGEFLHDTGLRHTLHHPPLSSFRQPWVRAPALLDASPHDMALDRHSNSNSGSLCDYNINARGHISRPRDFEPWARIKTRSSHFVSSKSTCEHSKRSGTEAKLDPLCLAPCSKQTRVERRQSRLKASAGRASTSNESESFML
jgi:hypothetical protein